MAGSESQKIMMSEERTKRQERARRILDAAAELILRWGYKKTAIDDIARLAGVAKGTIYLHWKSREDLFVTLLLRESAETGREILTRIAADPCGISLSNVVKHSLLVTMTRPLARALFSEDAQVLGELLHYENEDLTALRQIKLLLGRQLLDLFRARGVLRTDQSMAEQIKIYTTLLAGTMMVDHYLPAEMHSTPAEAAERLAALIHVALEPVEPVPPTVQHELRALWDQVAREMMRQLDERLQTELS